ncbi:SMI1/KNR4 family protein [Bacillus suaedaesalsae]|uniref:SMI1/KNR4 family protein n=1 Tax=Bacillus suaedaesalsae TaxID=2810349 RepID=A0ABS2DE08_9BACI|nr:SMI1/KNR4 family protein [Bacillus suaedaesalsae]MBM6616701.1 SMI1/KNR4 family protein [Bacillus suaedaesalsae]
MNLNNIRELILNPPANVMDIEKVETKLHTKLPTSYKELLQYSNGVSTNAGILIYGTEDLIERNETWETEVYAPSFISIGDDSGGKVILLSQDAENKDVMIVDSRDMNPENASLISNDFIQWVNSGLKIDNEEKTDINWAENCKIVIVDTQEGALKDLIRVKSVLGLNLPTSELLKGTKKLPYILTEQIPYGKAKKLIEKLGDLNLKIELL